MQRKTGNCSSPGCQVQCMLYSYSHRVKAYHGFFRELIQLWCRLVHSAIQADTTEVLDMCPLVCQPGWHRQLQSGRGSVGRVPGYAAGAGTVIHPPHQPLGGQQWGKGSNTGTTSEGVGAAGAFPCSSHALYKL